MNDILKEKLRVIGQDPYTLLEIATSAAKDKIDSNYRNLALKHHPDRTKDSKMTQAKQLLNDPQLRQQYDHYLATQAENQRRLEAMGEERRRMAEDLKQRERQAQMMSKFDRQEKERRMRFQEQREKQEMEKQRFRQEVMKQMKPSQYYKSICSIKMNWGRSNLKFNKKLLEIGFEVYGKIEGVEVNGTEGVVQFQSIESADQAVKEFQHPVLRVEYLIPQEKRVKLLKVLNTNKKEKLDLSLSSDNLKRLKQIINRNSNAYQNKQTGGHVNMEQILRRQNLYSS